MANSRIVKRVGAPIDPTKIKKQDIIAIIDAKNLHQFMLKKIGDELNNLIDECYYPRVSSIFKDLLHTTKANEKELVKYSKVKFKNPHWKLLHDSQTILLVLVAQEFTKNKDYAAALSTINLLSLRYYTNIMYKFVRYCNSNYFRAAIDKLSHNHLFTTKKTVGSAVLYLASQVYTKYQKALLSDDPEQIVAMIYTLRGRINQSIRSFAQKYYEISESQEKTSITSEDMPEEQSRDQKLKIVAGRIARDVTVYGKIDHPAEKEAQQITKFSKKLAIQFAQSLAEPTHTNNLEMLTFQLLREVQKVDNTKIEYLKITKKLMSVKVSKKPVFFKKTLMAIHNQIIIDLGYAQQFGKLSVQSKHISRSFLAYYVSLIVHGYFN